jgi:XapX domain-containing protein
LKAHMVALAAGVLVGVIYGLISVRSPAPPIIGLVGLLGILIGEQAVPLAKRVMSSQPVTMSWLREECEPHVFGKLPVGRTLGRPPGSFGQASEHSRPDPGSRRSEGGK